MINSLFPLPSLPVIRARLFIKLADCFCYPGPLTAISLGNILRVSLSHFHALSLSLSPHPSPIQLRFIGIFIKQKTLAKQYFNRINPTCRNAGKRGRCLGCTPKFCFLGGGEYFILVENSSNKNRLTELSDNIFVTHVVSQQLNYNSVMPIDKTAAINVHNNYNFYNTGCNEPHNLKRKIVKNDQS